VRRISRDDSSQVESGKRLRGSHLLEGLVIDEAGRIFGKIKLPALNLLSELPAGGQFPLET
jgi:hypothetical protein